MTLPAHNKEKASSLSAAEYQQRRRLAAEGLAARKLDTLVVTSLANVRYLTGFTGSNGLVLLFPDRAVLFTDPRYTLQAAAETGCKVRVERGSLLPAAAKWLRRRSARRIGYEKNNISHQSFLALEDHLPGRCRAIPVDDLVESLRMIKSPREMELIRRSVLLNSQAFAQTFPLVRPGVSETDLAAELEYRMRRLGAEKPAFETIVAFGSRSALPHASPSPNRLTSRGLLLIDAGAVWQGYSSDMTRTVFLGRPSAKIRSLYRAVLEAQLAALAAVREGATAGAVDRAARRVLQKHGLEPAFVHSTGHGLGLEIHEIPRLGRNDKTRLRAGMAVTIEPGVYLQGLGGIRIEDTVAVTRSGCDVLTPTSKELAVI